MIYLRVEANVDADEEEAFRNKNFQALAEESVVISITSSLEIF